MMKMENFMIMIQIKQLILIAVLMDILGKKQKEINVGAVGLIKRLKYE